MDTIHGQLKKAGVPLDHSGTNLHALVTQKSRAIIEQNGISARVNIFYNKDDHQPWFNIPYAYIPAEDNEINLDTPAKTENKPVDLDVKRLLEEEIQKAARELIEEQKKVIQQAFEQRKAILRQIVEEKRAALSKTEEPKQPPVKLES